MYTGSDRLLIRGRIQTTIVLVTGVGAGRGGAYDWRSEACQGSRHIVALGRPGLFRVDFAPLAKTTQVKVPAI